MNQILMTENKKKNKSRKSKSSLAPIEIKNIVRFFAIVIIIFSLCIIGHSSYAIYREEKGNNTDNLPTVNITRINDTLIIDVQSDYIINKFKYNWENSAQTSIPESNKSFQEEIILPSENNILTITLEDETGRAVTFIKEIMLDGIDIVKPNINIEQGQGATIKINVSDETKIEYLTYQIDNGEIIKIDKNNDDDKTIEYVVDRIPRGEHTIYVIAVDSFGNTEKAESPVIVSSDRPTIKNISIDKERNKILIEAADVDGLQSIEVNLNGQVYNMNDINRKDATFSLSLKDGKNTISIKITNVNGLTAEGATEFDYAR